MASGPGNSETCTRAPAESGVAHGAHQRGQIKVDRPVRISKCPPAPHPPAGLSEPEDLGKIVNVSLTGESAARLAARPYPPSCEHHDDEHAAEYQNGVRRQWHRGEEKRVHSNDPAICAGLPPPADNIPTGGVRRIEEMRGIDCQSVRPEGAVPC